LVCDIAIRAYWLERGHLPARLSNLVPDYLPQVPLDPFGGGEFVYRPTPTGFQLCSAGADPDTGYLMLDGLSP
jgi:hypothetical protein